MSGVVLYFDDDARIVKNFKNAFEQAVPELEFIGLSNPETFKGHLKDTEFMRKVRVLIFDLAKNQTEEVSHSFEIKTEIISNFNDYRIPIFIHSAFATYFTELGDKGTVFKIEKSGTAIQTICEKIKLMHESGFLEIFCPGGILESSCIIELHRAFTEQFKDNEIEGIIKSIKESTSGDCKGRVKEVFVRIAVRSLMHNLVSPSGAILSSSSAETKLNAIEHYYRRTSLHDVWTGDIFKKNAGDETLIVMTPRCTAIDPACTLILVCKIVDFKDNPTRDDITSALRDNPQLTGYKSRILTRTSIYKGGKIDFSQHFTIPKSQLKSDYQRMVTLSDELANDVVRKFCAYLLRSGVAETEIEETMKYLEIMKGDART